MGLLAAATRGNALAAAVFDASTSLHFGRQGTRCRPPLIGAKDLSQAGGGVGEVDVFELSLQGA